MSYKLISIFDANDEYELQSSTFDDAQDEALEFLEWYVIDEGEEFVGVNDTDPNDTVELQEPEFEDAQYELIEHLGYFISETSDLQSL